MLQNYRILLEYEQYHDEEEYKSKSENNFYPFGKTSDWEQL